MLTRLCGYLRNYFEKEKIYGTFTINNGTITGDGWAVDYAPTVQENQYIRIVGSVFNDGVWQFKGSGITGLQNETFDGAIWLLAIPKDVLAIADEIKTWETTYGEAVNSPFSSESLSSNSYSYSKASGGDGASVTWQSVFGSRLTQWRKI